MLVWLNLELDMGLIPYLGLEEFHLRPSSGTLIGLDLGLCLSYPGTCTCTCDFLVLTWNLTLL